MAPVAATTTTSTATTSSSVFSWHTAQQQQQQQQQGCSRTTRTTTPAPPLPHVVVTPPQDDESNVKAADDDDDDDSSCASSCDTHDALLDMLGLRFQDPAGNGSGCGDAAAEEENPLWSVLHMDDDDDDDPEAPATTTTTTTLLTSTPLSLPLKCSRYGHAPHQCAAVVVDAFWSPADCAALLQLARTRSTTRGYQYITEATHTAPDGSTYQVQLQNPNPHKLVVFEDAETLDRLWHRLVHRTRLMDAPWLEAFQRRTGCGPPVGLNPRLRVLRYDATDQDRFEPHFDATTHVGATRTSRITVLLYLNHGEGHDFDGGETLYLNAHISNFGSSPTTRSRHNDDNTTSDHHHHQTDGSGVTKVIPTTGKLVMFEHDLYHAGAPLQWGTKHVLRTDILFASSSATSKEDDGKDSDDDDGKDGDTNTNDAPATSDGDTTSKCPKALLVADLVVGQNWSSEDQQVLDDMGLWHMTLEAFLVPGTHLLTALLVDGGLHEGQVQGLLQAAQEHVQRQ